MSGRDTPAVKAADVVRDPAAFRRWWQRRDLPNDRAILRAALAGGLVSKGGGLLFLTAAGVALRRARAALDTPSTDPFGLTCEV